MITNYGALKASPDSASAAATSAGAQQTSVPPLPEGAIAIIPMRGMVLFPGIVLPVTLGRERSIAAAQEAVGAGQPVGLLLQRDPEQAEPTGADLHPVGTTAAVVRYLTAPDGTHHLIAQGEHRFRVTEFLDGWPFLVARVETIGEAEVFTKDVEARFEQVKQRALEALQLLPQAPQELVNAIQTARSPAALADLVAGFMDVKPADKQVVLEMFDVQERLDKVLTMLAHRIEVLRLSREIGEQTQQSMDTRQREYLLREQLKNIQKELGDGDAGQAEELAELAKAIADAKMPEEVEAQARKELKRLERMGESSGESSMVRSYLDWLAALPWSKTSAEAIDIARARAMSMASAVSIDHGSSISQSR